MAIQIGKYKRPGIFIEEIDKSVFTTPTVEGITNLVMGVSKKGPVNTPIRLTSVNDLEAVFGPLDRNLERKGSFFHRTVSKMLETSPVFAMNLLLTDDTLDVIEYKSLSSSAYYLNDIKREGPYRRFFDTTGFWKRDTESFINLTKPNTGYSERAFSFTNLSDRYVTVFVIKSQRTGFDRTLLEWYGSIEKMPAYLNPQDYASDYLVDVVVIAGDWTDYKNLAVDNRWGQYFNAEGLIKTQLRAFANDRNITTLAYAEGLSLIPYFRDLEGQNIFIETVINRGTDQHGVFCAFNADLVEKDFYSGVVDLLGATLVGSEKREIDFLSYKETIVQSVDYVATPLDLPGNVVALFGTYSFTQQNPHAYGYPTTSGVVYNGNRTAWFAEGAILNINYTENTGITASGTSSYIRVSYNAAADAYAVIGGEYVGVSAGTYSTTLRSIDYPFSTTVATYSTAFILGSNGEISSVTSYTPGVNPTVNISDLVLGFIKVGVSSQTFVGTSFEGVYLTGNVGGIDVVVPEYVDDAYTFSAGSSNDFAYGTFSASDDYYIYDMSNTPGYSVGDIKVVFWGTDATPNPKNYNQYRKYKTFTNILSALGTFKDRATLVWSANGNDKVKKSCATMTLAEVVSSDSQNKSFVLKTGLSDVSYITDNGLLTIYLTDNEYIVGKKGLRTQDTAATDQIGIAAKYSEFYQNFENGLINSKDYFYVNRLYTDESFTMENSILTDSHKVNVRFINGEASPSPTNVVTGLTSDYAGYNYIVFETPTLGATQAYQAINLQVLEKVKFPDSSENTTTFTLVANTVNPTNQSPAQLATSLGFTGSNYIAYTVAENVTFELLEDIKMMWGVNADSTYFLKMFTDIDGTLEVSFMTDNTLQTNVDEVSRVANYSIQVQSELSNLRQTVEIEKVSGYTEVPNKILVNGSRYAEIKVGDFLEADNSDIAMELGQEFQRNYTRVLSKRQYAGNTELAEITCDAKIKKVAYTNDNGGLDYQTTRYSTVDQYATTYKGIALKGFRIRQASMPDGTEAKQNQILNLVAKGTPLFKALINKEAFDFRYLVDAFGLGLTERSKQQLVDICGERLNVFGFINMPSLKSFKNSSSPSFVNAEGVLQAEYIAKGGDPESNPAFLYSFGDGPGVTTVGYFTPYVTVNDNGRPLDVPPASYVATTFMRKHISNVSSVTPWTIAAGVVNGRVTNIAGVEHEFDPTDIEFLNGAQMNPIVLKRNRGYVIETENTALTLYKSALSFIHVREVLVELERELAAMLLDYQWRFNTPDVRAEIKLRADVICETYVNKNGLFNYFNKMDDENNTSDIIDNQIGVLDTYVEPIKGMGIIVNNITILRTGAIAAGGFINA